MLASQIIQDVRRELIETSAQFWSDDELLRSINRCELDYVNKTRMLEDTAQVTLTQGQLEYPLPSNWISARMILFKVLNDDGTFYWMRLNPTNLEKMGQENQNFLNNDTNNQGMPHKYWVWGKSLWLDKAPDANNATSLYMFFKSKPIALTSTSQSINLDDALSEAITAYVLAKAWIKEGEEDKAAENRLVYDKYVLEGRRWVKKQQGDRHIGMDIISNIDFQGNGPAFGPLGGF